VKRIAPVNNRDEDFHVRLGRIRDHGGGQSFVDQVLRAAKKAGYSGWYTAAGRRYGRSIFGRGRAAFGRSQLFAGHRRVVVKARVVRHQARAFRSAPLSAHIAYLERDVSRDSQKVICSAPRKTNRTLRPSQHAAMTIGITSASSSRRRMPPR
jgi:hypothetical protein